MAGTSRALKKKGGAFIGSADLTVIKGRTCPRLIFDGTVNPYEEEESERKNV